MGLFDVWRGYSEQRGKSAESQAKVRHVDAETARVNAETRAKLAASQLERMKFDEDVRRWDAETQERRAILNAQFTLINHAKRTGANLDFKGLSISYPRAPVVVTEQEPAALPPAAVPTLRELLRQGTIQKQLAQGQLLLGYVKDTETGQWIPRYGRWLDLYSCAIAGVLGSGKTNTALFLLSQAVIAGASLIVIDPHMSDPEESLAHRMRGLHSRMVFEPCDDDPRLVLERVRWARKEFRRRKALGLKGPATILVIDEFNALMRRDEIAKEMAELLTEIEQEARKFGIFAMLIGQHWSAQGIGGAVVRQCLASALVHRMSDIDQAKKLLGLPQHARAALQLAKGHHVFRDTDGGYNEMITPLVDDDVMQLLGRAADETSGETSSKPVRNQVTEPLAIGAPNTLRNQSETSSRNQFDAALQTKARSIIKLLSQGKTKPEIMRVLWDVSPGKSVAYDQANEEFTAAMKLAQQILEGA